MTSRSSSASSEKFGEEKRSASTWSMKLDDHARTISPQPIQIPSDVRCALDSKGLVANATGSVSWSSDSTLHPRRWSIPRKAYSTAVICFMEFTMTVVSNSGSSIVPTAVPDLHIGETLGLFHFTTLYLLGQAIGGIIVAPVSESFGSQTIWTTCNIGFAAACVAIGSCRTSVAVIAVGRFLSGFMSAMPSVAAASSIENMWDTKARIWVMHSWIVSTVLALAIAPPITTAIVESSLGWQWVFYIASIATTVIAILCAFMWESRPSRALRIEVKDIMHECDFRGLTAADQERPATLESFVRDCLTFPIRLFFTEPIVFLTSIMAASVYGLIYLFSAVLPSVYTELSGLTTMQGALVFLAILVGIAFSFLPRIYDIKLLGHRSTPSIQPEEKLLGFYVAAPVLAISFWWFGLTVPPLFPSISAWASIPSLALFGFAVVEFDNVLSGYLCDAYAAYTASAMAPMSFLRACLSGGLPLLGSAMFNNLNANNALFLLAAIATAYCGVAVLFWLYGKRIREVSPFAEHTRQMSVVPA